MVPQAIGTLHVPAYGGHLDAVHQPREEFLRESLSSIFNQIYPLWNSPLSTADRRTRKSGPCCRKWKKTPGSKVLYQKGAERDTTLIAKIMKKTSADYLLLTGAEDVLEPYALYNMVAVMQGAVELDFVFSDSDLLDENGLRFEPQFKPQWAVGAHYPLVITSIPCCCMSA